MNDVFGHCVSCGARHEWDEDDEHRDICMCGGKLVEGSNAESMVDRSSTASGVRRVELVRTNDESGVSGTGRVAVGCLLPSGAVVLEWLNDKNEALAASENGLFIKPGPNGFDDTVEVHGHDGKTELRLADLKGGIEVTVNGVPTLAPKTGGADPDVILEAAGLSPKLHDLYWEGDFSKRCTTPTIWSDGDRFTAVKRGYTRE